MLSRVAQHSQHTISVDLEVDGAPTDAAGTVTVAVVKADGTSLASGNATKNGTGHYEFTLTPTHTAALNFLTATWTATLDGASQRFTTHHEIVGSHVVSVAELRRHEPLDDEDTYSADDLIRARDLATYSLERSCNRGFTTHYARETIRTDGTSYLPLKGRQIRSLASVSVGGVAFDESALAAVFVDSTGYLTRDYPWATGGSAVVEYTYGEQVAHPDVSRAICKIAAEVLFEDALDGDGSAIPERATSLSTEAGTFALVTAGVGAAAYDLPEVNRVVSDWRLP